MGGPSNKQKAAEANRRMKEANSADNETNWLSNKNVDSKRAFSSPAGPSAPIPSLDTQAIGSALAPTASSFLPVQESPATGARHFTAERFMAMVDAVDDESKATIYGASVYLKMVSNAETEEGRKENEAISSNIFGPDTDGVTTSVEDSIFDSHGNLDPSKAWMLRLKETLPMIASTPVPDPWDLARMDRSSSGTTPPSPAHPSSASPVQDHDQDWRSGLTHDERAARLAEMFEALETEDAQRNLEADQPEPTTTAPTDAATSAQSTVDPAQPSINPSFASNRPSMTFRDLAGLVKQFLEASASRFDKSNLCCVLEFSKAVEIFGEDGFVREPGQSRDVLRPGSIVFKYAQKAGLPAGIFRWLQGIPDLSTEFQYPAATMVETVRQLTARGI